MTACMHYFYHNPYSTTIHTQYSVLVKAHEDTGNYRFEKEFTYNHFRWSWYSFLKLLKAHEDTGNYRFEKGLELVLIFKIDPSSAFMCPECGTAPDIVLMDATSLSFRKEFLQWKADETLLRERSQFGR